MFWPEPTEEEARREAESAMDGLVVAMVLAVYGASCGIIGWVIHDYPW